MRTISVVTGARSDYGIYRPVLRAIQDDPDLALRLIACGAHLSHDFGHSVDDIEADGIAVSERIETLLGYDTPEAIARSTGRGVTAFAESFAHTRPELLLVLGDRYEMFAAAAAALPFAVPLGHIHGGEATEGLIDEAIRHSITKMSHLHFVATEAYRTRVIQLGEAPDRVTVSGAPGLDNLHGLEYQPREVLADIVGLDLSTAPLLVTHHPVTLEYEDTEIHIDTLLQVLAGISRPKIFTYPNADTQGQIVIAAIDRFVAAGEDAVAVPNLGTRTYFSLMREAAAMVGNSSSGIIEAASFGLPVVDIGNRQRGRVRGANVIHAEPSGDAIRTALDAALSPEFRDSLSGMANPYGDGRAAGRIVRVLRDTPLDRALIEKRFHDLN